MADDEKKRPPPAPPPKEREPQDAEKTVTRHPNKMVGGRSYLTK